MTYNYEGSEYKVIYQNDLELIQLTTAFRVDTNHFADIISVCEYKTIGKTEVETSRVHIGDLIKIAAEVKRETVSV